ncbi:MotA/TolQ/ExbB proton channel family protein [Luteolibacter marinus]|uniref:MotA/TolQ/ExbB proton channel family protein n=1 Tax=Luteolibacter marinus TaxID=2776705 RepID=UPI001866CEC1|nr:MotA/TolQ/ExbB proton channel family protein [Luteolibacter marinus]
MKPALPLFLLGLLAAPLHAQDPVERSRADLTQARKELDSTHKEYTDLRAGVYREINRLDDEALKLSKELRALEHEREQRTAHKRTLENNLLTEKTNFDYSAGILNNYGKSMATRLHPAENQLLLEKIQQAEQRAAAAGTDHIAELKERMDIARLGLQRLGAISGGQRFEGKALRNGSEALKGSFLMLGPAVLFAEQNGGFEGVASFAATGSGLPTVVAISQDGSTPFAGTIASGKGEVPLDGSMGKAIEVAAAQESIGETVEKGGIVGHCILGLGLIALLLTTFKVFEITRFPVPSRREINAILDDLIAHRRQDAIAKADKLQGMAGDLVQTGVQRFHEKRRILEEAMFEKMVSIKPRLERFLPFLGLTAAAAPLMGLLGTVLGIIKTFKQMAIYGTGNASSFSAGISEALITTAEGLVVAIPVLVLHGMMKSLVKSKFGEVEAIAIALMNGTTEVERRTARASLDDTDEDDIEFAPSPA